MPSRSRRACLVLISSAFASAHAGAFLLPGPARAESAARETDWSRAELVTIALEEYRYEPEQLQLQEGRPYLLRFVNRGTRPHDFASPAFFAAATMRPGDPIAEELRERGGTLNVPTSATRELAVIPRRAGSYPVGCHTPMHDLFGMAGRVVVLA